MGALYPKQRLLRCNPLMTLQRGKALGGPRHEVFQGTFVCPVTHDDSRRAAESQTQGILRAVHRLHRRSASCASIALCRSHRVTRAQQRSATSIPAMDRPPQMHRAGRCGPVYFLALRRRPASSSRLRLPRRCVPSYGRRMSRRDTHVERGRSSVRRFGLMHVQVCA